MCIFLVSGLKLDRHEERERGKSPLGRLWQLAPYSDIQAQVARSTLWGMNAAPIGDKGPECAGLAMAGRARRRGCCTRSGPSP